jgi:hypothetical protein
VTTQQAGGASTASGSMLGLPQILTLGAFLAISVILMYHIHWS